MEGGWATMDEPLTVGIEDAAKLLGISRGLMYRLVREKQIPALKLGRRLLIGKSTIAVMASGNWQPPMKS
jgi:excisionase family DNA binding protein